MLAFTSGTAGSPKPAILSHAALSVNIEQQKASAADRVRADDVTLGVAPLSHIMGLNSVLSSSLSVGASTLLIERFDPVLALESMQKHGVTVAVGPPTMWSSWLNLPDLPADRRRAVGEAWCRMSVPELDADALVTTVLGILDDPAFADIFAPGAASRCPGWRCAWSTATVTMC